MTTGPEEGTCAHPDEGPGGMPLALRLSEGLGVAAQPLPFWVPVASALPAMDMPVWLYAPDRGIWVGARLDLGDGWMWGNTYGTHYYAETSGAVGAWRCHDNEVDDDYLPTMWMPLPLAPTPNVRANLRAEV
jgi:hypothetical protein